MAFNLEFQKKKSEPLLHTLLGAVTNYVIPLRWVGGQKNITITNFISRLKDIIFLLYINFRNENKNKFLETQVFDKVLNFSLFELCMTCDEWLRPILNFIK